SHAELMRTVCLWSGGKDAAYALFELQGTDNVTVERLLTTVSAATNRSSMHGVRRELYDRQADALGLPIEFVELPPEPTNETYEEVMDEYANRGIERIGWQNQKASITTIRFPSVFAGDDLTAFTFWRSVMTD
ncbi:MAG TPA: hypothetical protein VFJ06_00030, partial [Halococcus sp.]|nr:hypothetical protein [Halococcus sp.]